VLYNYIPLVKLLIQTEFGRMHYPTQGSTEIFQIESCTTQFASPDPFHDNSMTPGYSLNSTVIVHLTL